MAESLRLLTDTLDTPIGELAIIADRQGNLRTLEWTDHDGRMRRLLRLHYGGAGGGKSLARCLCCGAATHSAPSCARSQRLRSMPPP